jgi:hypothetical protein
VSNRSFYIFRGSLNREVVTLYGKVTTSTAGAVSSQKSKGFSVARTGTGAYTITLENAYADLLGVQVTVVGANTASKGLTPVVTTSSVTNKSLVVQLVSAPGTAADVVDGAVVVFAITLSRVVL